MCALSVEIKRDDSSELLERVYQYWEGGNRQVGSLVTTKHGGKLFLPDRLSFTAEELKKIAEAMERHLS